MARLVKRFFKYLQILNQARNPWEISLAFFLGAFCGALPFFHWLHLVLPLLILFLNVNFSIFLATFFLFYGISGALDPMFLALGTAALESQALTGLWTGLYGNALFRIFAMNHTLTMGVFLFFALVAIPYFWVANKILAKTILTLRRLSKVPVLGFFLGGPPPEIEEPQSEQTEQEAASSAEATETETEEKGEVPPQKTPTFPPYRPFRWGRLAIALVASVLFLGASYLLLPFVLKMGIAKGLSLALQKPVAIGSASFTPPSSLKLTALAVAESEKSQRNDFEIAQISLALDLLAFLEGRIHIQEAVLKNIQWETLRTVTDDKSEKSEKEKSSSSLSLSLDSLVKYPEKIGEEFFRREKFASWEAVEKDRQHLLRLYEKWQTKLTSWKERLQSRKKELESFKSRAKNLSSLSEAKQLYRDIQNFRQKLRQDTADLAALRREWRQDLKATRGMAARWDQLAKEDLARLRKKYALSEGGGVRIASLLFGERIEYLIRGASQGLRIYRLLFGRKRRKPLPRGKGKWVTFPLPKGHPANRPQVLVEKVELDLVLGTVHLTGEGQDLSSNPELWQKPGTLEFQLTHKGAQGKLTCLLDRKQGRDHIKGVFSVQKIPLQGMKLGGQISLAKATVAVELNFQVVEDRLDGEGYVTFEGVQFQMAKQSSGKGPEGLLQKALQEVDSFGIKVTLSGTLDSPKVKLSSDLDSQLSQSVKKVLERENQKFVQRLEQAFQGQWSARRRRGAQALEKFQNIRQVFDEHTQGLQVFESAASRYSLKELSKKFLGGWWK